MNVYAELTLNDDLSKGRDHFMKLTMKRFTTVCVAMLLTVCLAFSSTVFTYAETEDDVAKVEVDFSIRRSFEDIEKILENLNEAYPEYSSLYSIGKTWEDRNIWCLEITDESVSADAKTGIGVFANIHGGERESAESGLYTGWWLLNNLEDATVREILKNHIVYVIPVINPDGYVQSDVYNTRQNMRPRDLDGDGVPFSDTYVDIDGDGYIATVYAASGEAGEGESPRSKTTGTVGTESNDANGDGILGNDPKNSGIDMNRNFDFHWGEDGVMDSEGPSAASEPEIQAIQNFIDTHQMDALTTLHTGIQSVLYPWCYRAANAEQDDMEDIAFMAETSEKMALAFEDTTQRNFYSKSSYEDYQTYSELIDYAYGLYGIHSYTIEVYSGGSNSKSAYQPGHDPQDDSICKWNNTLPEATWVYYSHDEISSKLGLDPSTLKVRSQNSYRALAEDEGLYFYTSSTSQMVDKAPEDQDIMVQGAKDAVLQMIFAEGKVSETHYTNEVMTFNIHTSKDVKSIKIYNENGSTIKINSLKKTVADNETVWKVAFAVGTAGEREFTVKGIMVGGVMSEVSSIDVNIVQPDPEIISVSAPDSALVYESFELDVTSTASVKSIRVSNEKGSNMGKKLLTKTIDGMNVNWAYEMEVGTAGEKRTFTVTGYGAGGVAGDKTGSFSIDVLKLVR